MSQSSPFLAELISHAQRQAADPEAERLRELVRQAFEEYEAPSGDMCSIEIEVSVADFSDPAIAMVTEPLLCSWDISLTRDEQGRPASLILRPLLLRPSWH